ncbi:EFR1 family ferrodoxin [Ruminiclostridium cellulolyticum]|uniref:4Fe-4S ferredoxin iron-sulfur binding domain protein n=1 Tax=Ruminiclostridium cellulolyticum (strain ATCC 35319 / DSM 5812 / JCM 6584 / H10) TaxID=394503 RepID=B8HZW1_RUMCH|nr:EFR1 family ferrodoxin [Ruminiclostridium cellulolyticum]ACL75461.1 4Fe-4S ferredoxin iron-sulfur binding domain protein [Ruminiclostridium cellulolyticum H10]
MIFWFSGTGNSFYTAKSIAQQNDLKLISISAAVNSGADIYEYALEDGEIIGFVFPVYAWAPPKMVLDFISKLKLKNYSSNYTFCVPTCGRNVGNTVKVMEKCLNKININLSAGFSIIMPNNYIVIGNVDSKDKESQKLAQAEKTLKNISQIISERKTGMFNVIKGPFPRLFTVVNPLFNKYAVKTESFYATDKCNGCGICEKVCTSKSIKVDKRPKWGKECTQCLACINFCPTKATQFGKGTEKKGRYTNPNVRISELSE